MSRLIITAPGIASIQDIGRFGLQRYGVAPAGAMDAGSLRRANTLVGCPVGTPAIEIGPLPVSIEVAGPPIRFALSGAPRTLSIDGESVPLDQTHVIRDAQRMKIGSARGGMFSYLCFEGGLVCELQHGSNSLDERAGFGSPLRRRLQAADVLEVPAATAWHSERSAASPSAGPARRDVIRVILGPQDDYFYPETIDRFLTTTWRTALSSNRMCYSLDGPLLAHAKGYNIVSDGTVKGSVQVAGSGQPLVLLADRGTVGGYPKIATLASIDMDRFVQIPPGGEVRFKAISVGEAQALLRTSGARDSIALREASRLPGINPAALASANLAGLATNALDPAAFD